MASTLDKKYYKKFSKKCTVCSVDFSSSKDTAVYCSMRCKKTASERRRLGRAFVHDTPIKCVTCGVEFFRKSKNHIYCCSDCRQTNVEKNKRTVYSRSCPSCGSGFKTTRRNGVYCSAQCASGRSGKKLSYFDKCECCGIDNKLVLQNHHINRPKKLGVITLCANCHVMFHKIKIGKEHWCESKSEVIDAITTASNTD